MAIRGTKAISTVKADAPESVAPPAATLKITKSVDYKTTYANHTKIPASQWDLGLTFGRIVELEGGSNVIEEEITIKLSPQYFKALVSSMTISLQEWEKTFGNLSIGLGQQGNPTGIADAFNKLTTFLTSAEERGRNKTD